MSKTEGSSPAWLWLGLTEVSGQYGSATVAMKATKDMTDDAGFVHGGMISALAGSTMERSLRTIDLVERAAGFDLKMNFISPAKAGETLRATGRVVHAGRRTAVTECRIEVGGNLVATATATFAVTREKE